ncbi:segregation/condensation protein A [Alteribacillus sp. HJP-4]|uniref:segregation/condensation protein A n=1 Tax=Alteribacillus sp. HJP-4 TaxID=2775394 RepID=UPI0035CCCEF6
MNRYNVKTEAFEGPLDLLLHLIHEAKVDIQNIPVAPITRQYLEYVHAMQELELDVASEYLVMAATLLEIKSNMLLPGDTELQEELLPEEMEEDPREGLMAKLIEYQKYKQAAAVLKDKEKENKRHYTKPPTIIEQNDQAGKLPEGVTLIDMVEAFMKMKERIKYQAPKTTTVRSDEISIDERMTEILSTLPAANESKRFSALFPVKEKSHIVITFLAILELVKNGEIICIQSGNFDDFTVCRTEEGVARDA